MSEPASRGPAASRPVALLALAASGLVLCAPVAGRAGWPGVASALALGAGLLGVASFGRALWAMRRRPLLEGGGA